LTERAALTSRKSRHAGRRPCSATAARWLRPDRGPHASTAASHRPSVVSAG
jgi:hypothetical protein